MGFLILQQNLYYDVVRPLRGRMLNFTYFYNHVIPLRLKQLLFVTFLLKEKY